jgi:hypothetical protein
VKDNKLPKTAKYVLRCQIFRGSEMPQLRSPLNPLECTKLQVVVSIGHHIIMSSRQKGKNGNLMWANHSDEKTYNMTKGIDDELEFPLDFEQVPDVFVYVTKGKITNFDTRNIDFKAICFRRFKVKDLIDQNFKGELTMIEDPVHNLLTDDEFPGSLLLRLGFGLKDTYERVMTNEPEVRQAWANANAMKETVSPYRVVVNVFQGRDLPAADSSSLLNPYVRVKFNWQKEKTQTLRQTISPVYMKSFGSTFSCSTGIWASRARPATTTFADKSSLIWTRMPSTCT